MSSSDTKAPSFKVGDIVEAALSPKFWGTIVRVYELSPGCRSFDPMAIDPGLHGTVHVFKGSQLRQSTAGSFGDLAKVIQDLLRIVAIAMSPALRARDPRVIIAEAFLAKLRGEVQ